MRKYYFISCSLPVLKLGLKPDISFEEFLNFLNWNLSSYDKEKLKRFRMYIDLNNIKPFLLNKSIDLRGNLDEKKLDQAILLEDFFYEGVFDFLKKYETKEEKIKYFSSLLSLFLQDVVKKEKGFLYFYFSLERKIRIILAALRAKEENKDIEKELFFEDKKCSFVEYIFLQKDMKSLEVPREYERVKEVFLKNKNDPKKLNLGLLKFRFEKYQEESEKSLFTIDYVLGYLANFILVEDLYKLDQKQGNLVVDSLL